MAYNIIPQRGVFSTIANLINENFQRIYQQILGLDGSGEQAAEDISQLESDVSALQSGKANDADVVHKAGAETITGNKTFTGTVKLPLQNSGILVTDENGVVQSDSIDFVTDVTYEAGDNIRYLKKTINGTKSNIVQVEVTPNSNSTGLVTSGGIYTALASKADKASPAFTGTPTAPTAASGTNTTQIATTAFVQSAVPKDYQVDYSKQYLTFEALESGTFTFTGYSTNTVSYSLDNGKTWTSLASATASPTISAGNRIMWKASGLSIDSTESGIGTFSATGNFNIEGNAMSLASGDEFIGKTTITAYQFRTLFKNNTKLISAENLILPATTASIGCYREMFYGCTGLTTPPKLPATTLSNNCYDAMFCGCTSLKTTPELYATTLASYSYRQLFDGCTLINHIVCLATDISASNCTQYITRNVASTGTFVIADGMTSWQRNYHGIPSAWTVRTESEMEHVTKGELDDVVGDIETLLASI